MLSYISVKNFAILENVEVHFESGLTALTGETGAGKSLLIDAIGLLLGDRANSDVIRSGESYCEVSGIFTNLSPVVAAMLKEVLPEDNHQQLLITRRIQTNSTNIIKLNTSTVTLQELKKIASHLADIHSQHDTKRLIHPENYLALIDHFDKRVEKIVTEYHTHRRNYQESLQIYQSLVSQKNETIEKSDYFRFQIEEIDKHNIKVNEEEAIQEEIEQLRNYDKIYQGLHQSVDAIESSQSVESIYNALKHLESIASFDKRYQEIKERMENIYYELEDLSQSLKDTSATLDFNPNRLDELESRQHQLATIKRKYQRTIDEIITYRETLKNQLLSFEDYDQLLIDKKKTLEEAFKTLLKTALYLRETRMQTAQLIEENLIASLADLALPNTRFKMVFDEKVPNDLFNPEGFRHDGIDSVDFLLSTNIGETMKPLGKVASGGELSRIMLALKSVLLKNLQLSLMIFDEIDTGVSGFVASQVALKIKEISRKNQVITITHVPQIAAKADHHYHIYKAEEAERTKAFVKVLNHQERILEIAKMISSKEVNEHAIKSAETLLK